MSALRHERRTSDQSAQVKTVRPAAMRPWPHNAAADVLAPPLMSFVIPPPPLSKAEAAKAEYRARKEETAQLLKEKQKALLELTSQVENQLSNPSWRTKSGDAHTKVLLEECQLASGSTRKLVRTASKALMPPPPPPPPSAPRPPQRLRIHGKLGHAVVMMDERGRKSSLNHNKLMRSETDASSGWRVNYLHDKVPAVVKARKAEEERLAELRARMWVPKADRPASQQRLPGVMSASNLNLKRPATGFTDKSDPQADIKPKIPVGWMKSHNSFGVWTVMRREDTAD